ncbi:hypothetical protein KKC97_02795 [bacterium]|nr:hypothetical protein [bacterium]MBU1636571.1 hypothetical protein [bacterium]
MKLLLSIILSALLIISVGCMPKKPEPVKKMPQQEQMPQNPHGSMTAGPKLDLEAMLANLPEGWKKVEASSSMRLAEVQLERAAGDTMDATLAVFHFPGTGGDATSNIRRWQGQMKGPHGEPGAEVAVTDTLTLYGITVITTDITGTQLPSGMGMGPSSEIPDSRMIASVIETGVGNWFFKFTGPAKTITAHEAKIRAFLKTAKLEEENINESTSTINEPTSTSSRANKPSESHAVTFNPPLRATTQGEEVVVFTRLIGEIRKWKSDFYPAQSTPRLESGMLVWDATAGYRVEVLIIKNDDGGIHSAVMTTK